MKRNGIISLIGIVLLAVLLLNGCAASAAEQLPEVIVKETQVTAAQTPDTAPVPAQEKGKLTADEAKAIALNHAGLTEDQVTGLRAEYDVDDGIPEYEVEFRQGKTEYDYEIHAETGEIRSWDKDLDN